MRAALWVAMLAGCTKPLTRLPEEKDVQDIDLTGLAPAAWVPGTVGTLSGSGFRPEFSGPTTVHLDGRIDNSVVDVSLPARFVDYDTLEVDWPGLDALGVRREGSFDGKVWVTTELTADGRTHSSPKRGAKMEMTELLTPEVDGVQGDATYLNDTWVVEGEGFLLGGAEGVGVLDVEGCFEPRGGSSCDPVGPVRIEGTSDLGRNSLTVPFSPALAGVERGTFVGTGRVLNVHADGSEVDGGTVDLAGEIGKPKLTGLIPLAASLGQFVTVEGQGFVGPTSADPTATTLVELVGTLQRGGQSLPIDVLLVPEFQDGRAVRYILNEEDGLGQLMDLRSAGAAFSGTARAVVAHGSDEVDGDPVPVGFEVAPVKQVVWLKFLPNYTESLRHFGLFAARDAIQERIVAVVERDYGAVNVELRLEEPTDFALYSIVEISGPDPNGLGLLGYDNTPGKDVGNQRLYDTIGGVNALTQQDGYPGYGGVFIESLFSFSADPGGFAVQGEVDPLFDELFDPFRPDRDGRPVSGSEVADRVVPSSNTDCPASGRSERVGCAVFALGNLVGTTVSHEIAHSVGLADPEGEAFHNTGDWEDALMDGGSYRTFAERAEVDGEGPGVFCEEAFGYLQGVLPTGEADPMAPRQECY